ncbi:MAG: mismatch-specific DNA-glycosylase [Thermoleophilia bacterium]
MAGHRITQEWMGAPVTTLADLLRPGLRAVVVGINPSPPSVAAGHYYQGILGRRFWARLRTAGVLGDAAPGLEDDALLAAGIGFTDVVKRPTARADGLGAAELRHGAALLRERLLEHRPGLVLFTYRRAADALLGARSGTGLLPRSGPGGADCFVMPGPYAPAAAVAPALEALRGLLGGAPA